MLKLGCCVLLVLLAAGPSASARPAPIKFVTRTIRKVVLAIKKTRWTLPAHLAIGAGVAVGVSAAAGWAAAPGIIAAGATAAFKEGTDLHDHRDTWKTAVQDAAEIMAGAAIAAVIE